MRSTPPTCVILLQNMNSIFFSFILLYCYSHSSLASIQFMHAITYNWGIIIAPTLDLFLPSFSPIHIYVHYSFMWTWRCADFFYTHLLTCLPASLLFFEKKNCDVFLMSKVYRLCDGYWRVNSKVSHVFVDMV